MANFKIALEKTLHNEGFYSNDKFDAGGETFKGIARKKNPNWLGWSVIDNYKLVNTFPNNLKGSKELEEKVEDFYKVFFWDKIMGDKIINQDVANDLFDTAVNMGIGQAVKLCQRSLSQPDNGLMNETTLNALNQANHYA